jgi:hypothetical protein
MMFIFYPFKVEKTLPDVSATTLKTNLVEPRITKQSRPFQYTLSPENFKANCHRGDVTVPDGNAFADPRLEISERLAKGLLDLWQKSAFNFESMVTKKCWPQTCIMQVFTACQAGNFQRNLPLHSIIVKFLSGIRGAQADFEESKNENLFSRRCT